MIRLYFSLLVILFTLGCSNTPKIETQHYLLMPEKKANITSQKSYNEKQVIIVEPIKLATFLDQRGIILLTDKHHLEAAHYHRWAEPLDQNIHRFMLEVLSANSNDFAFDNPSKFSYHISNLSLSIDITQFNGTAHGKALLSGSWKLIDTEKNELVLSDEFNYTGDIAKSGYSELVNQLAIMLDEISLQILKAISSIN